MPYGITKSLIKPVENEGFQVPTFRIQGPWTGRRPLSNRIHLCKVERQSGHGYSNANMEERNTTMGGGELEPSSNRMLDAMMNFGFRFEC